MILRLSAEESFVYNVFACIVSFTEVIPSMTTRFFAEFILSVNDEILHFVQNDTQRTQNDKGFIIIHKGLRMTACRCIWNNHVQLKGVNNG